MAQAEAPQPTPAEQLVFDLPDFLSTKDSELVRVVMLRQDAFIRQRNPSLMLGDVRYNPGLGYIYSPQYYGEIEPEDPRLKSGELIFVSREVEKGKIVLLEYAQDDEIEGAIRRAVHTQASSAEVRQNTHELLGIFEDMVVLLHTHPSLRDETAIQIVNRVRATLQSKGFMKPRKELKRETQKELHELTEEGIYIDSMGRVNTPAMETKWVARWRKLMYELLVADKTQQKFSYKELVLRDEREFERRELERLVAFAESLDRTQVDSKEFVRKSGDFEELARSLIDDEVVKVQPYVGDLALFNALVFGIAIKGLHRTRINSILGQSRQAGIAREDLLKRAQELEKLRIEAENQDDKGEKDRLLRERASLIQERVREFIGIVTHSLYVGFVNLPEDIKPSGRRKEVKRISRKPRKPASKTKAE